MNKQQYPHLSCMIAAVALSGACGQINSSSQALKAVAPSAAPAPIDAKLFYDFPLDAYAKSDKVITEPGGSGPIPVSFAISKVIDVRDGLEHWSLNATKQWGFDHGTWRLNLETGEAYIGIAHTGRSHNTAAPAKGGNLFRYLDDLAEIKDVAGQVGAPQQALDYISKIEAYVPTVASDQILLNNDHTYPLVTGQVTAFKVRYLTTQTRDLVLSFFDAHDSDSQRPLFEGRVTVSPGMGEAVVPVLIDVPAGKNVCTFAKVIEQGDLGNAKVLASDSPGTCYKVNRG